VNIPELLTKLIRRPPEPKPAAGPPIRFVDYLGKRILFHTPTVSTNWRVDHFFDAEPETLDWLKRMTPDDILFDVGANVGVYSLIAAKVHGARVFSFEPEAANFALLNKNILDNQCGDLICAYCLAIFDAVALDRFNVACLDAGNSMHAFGEARHAPDLMSSSTDLVPFEPLHRQGAVSFPIDELIARGLPAPTFLKVDVDGFEDKVVSGATSLIERPGRLTLLIEANSRVETHGRMLRHLEELGFSCTARGSNFILDR